MCQGHKISAGKIHFGSLQYLTRLLECDSHPGGAVRPLGPSISSLITGNWYSQTQEVAFDMVASARNMARELMLRGMHQERALKYLVWALDRKMVVK